MMMYCNLYSAKRCREYVRFTRAYLEHSPVRKEEFKWLHVILKTRWLEQIFYHQYRYTEGITQGLESGNVEENLQGVEDGIFLLKELEKLPKDFFLRILD
jgi:hypothetical protein